MKNKKVLRLSLIGAGAIGIAFAMTAVIGHNTGLFVGKGFDGHTAACEWNHYTEYAPTYEHAGCAEFWACCTHPGNHVLTAPESTHITDMGPYIGELEVQDDRYLPMLEGGNKYAQLDVIGWQDDALLYSVNQYTGIQTVIMKVRVVGEYNSWFAIGVGSDHSDWDGHKNFTTGLDGEWHIVTANIGGLDGYVNFCYNLDHVQEGHIDVDDITIITSDGVYFEDFENNTLMALDANHARIAQVAPGNRFLREDAAHIDNEEVLVYTAKQYTGVTNVSYKVRIPEGKGQWGGVAVASNLSIYNNTDPKYPADGTWHSVSQDFGGLDGYVEFCHEQGNFVGPLDIDDVVITYDGGKVAYEGFDGESIFRVRKAELATIVLGEPGKEIGVTALNAVTTTVENREYSPLFTASKGIDAEYGSYVQLDDWQCASNQDRCWIGFTQTESLALINARLGGAELESYYLFIYNPLDTSFSLQIMLDHHYTNVSTASLASKAWTKVTMPVGAYGSYTLTQAHQIGFDHPFGAGHEGSVLGSGWKFTSIYAQPKINANFFARLHADTYSSGTSPLFTTSTYANITSVSFDYCLTGGPKASGGWWGIGIHSGHGLYDGMHTDYTPNEWDGQWRSKTISLANPESGYVNIVHAIGELVDGSTIDIDNIVITYDNGQTVTEDFMNGYNYFQVYSNHPEAVSLIAQ